MSASIKLGNDTPVNFYVGDREVKSIYLGSIRVWGQVAPVENLQLSPNGTVSFSAAGESKSITVTSHATWYVSKDSSNWISLNKNSGESGESCLITCTENTDFSPRTGTVTFTCGLLSESITVYQAPFEPEFVVEPTSFNLNSSASTTITFSFTIDSRCDWTIGSSSWITVDPNNIHGSGSRQNVQATIAANTGGQRTGYSSISEDDGQANTVEISVTQKGVTVNPKVEITAINWDNDDDDGNSNWANKQSWQIKLTGGSSSITLNNVSAKIVDDGGNEIEVLDVPSSITLNANQIIYLGRNDTDINDPTKAQLSLNGQTVFDNDYTLAFNSDSLYDQALFLHKEI